MSGKGFLTFILTGAMALFMLCALAPTVLAQPSGCPTGMTGYWKFDESSGGPYDDFYGVNDATCSSCPATVTGKLGNGLDFDGTNNRVDVPDDNSFDWDEFTSFTIEFWMRSSGCVCTEGGYNCNQVIAGRVAAGWWIGVNCQTPGSGSINKLRCVFGTIDGPTDFYSNASVNDDVWHHVVYQFDRAAGSSGQYRLYIDGVLDNSVFADGATRAGAGPIQLGYYSTAYQYAGLLDEFAVYNQALSLSDIQSHWNSGNGQSYCISNLPPVVSDIADATIAEGGSFATINLDEFVADPDNLDTEISWTVSGNVNLSVSIDVNRVATITVINPEWNGSETITFTATDLGSLSGSDPATFTVTAVNDAPVVGDIPGQTVGEGTALGTIDLDTYVTDPDNLVTDINWTASGNVNLSVSISPSHVATITVIDPEWNGSETITFTATDPGPLSDSDPATFIVTPSMMRRW